MRIAVVGGGILGVAVANRLTTVRPDAQVTLLEKEHRLAAHQTGHNSGVVHAGIYYAPGSLKAQLCRRGVGLLRALCVEEGIAYDECGKLVVALTEDELPRLDELERRATANGVPGLRRVSAAEIREIEPHAVGVAALHSPETAIVDFVAVTNAIADRARRAGAEILDGREVTGISRVADGVVLQTADGDESPPTWPWSARACSPTGWRSSPGQPASRRSCRSAGSTTSCAPTAAPRTRADLPGPRSAVPVPRHPPDEAVQRRGARRPQRGARACARGLPVRGKVKSRDLAGTLGYAGSASWPAAIGAPVRPRVSGSLSKRRSSPRPPSTSRSLRADDVVRGLRGTSPSPRPLRLPRRRLPALPARPRARRTTRPPWRHLALAIAEYVVDQFPEAPTRS